MPAAVKDSATGRAENEDLVVTIAVDVLAAKGWLEEEPDDALIAALHRLYRANPVCQLQVRYTGELLHDMLASRPGEHLAGFYENECQEAWERTVATWTCDCGQTYKVLPGGLPGRPDDRFYRLGVDGVLGALVGTTRGIGISHNKACPGCGRDFATTVRRFAESAAAAVRGRVMAPISNLVCEGDLDAMKGRGWIERAREPIPHEGRILVTLWHPRQTAGEGCDRYYTAVETFRSLPFDDSGPSQLALFPQPA